MKKTKLTISSTVASLVLSSFASAGQSTSATASNIGGYLEVSGVTGSETLDLSALDEGKPSQHVSGVRFDGGLSFGNGLSLDGRFEHIEDKYSDSQDELRALVNYKQEVAPGISAFFGAGYGHQHAEALFLILDSDAVLANAGVEFTSGQFFGSLVYTHAFTTSATLTAFPDTDINVDKVDIGYLEGRLGYHLTQQLSAVASLEGQVTGDSYLQKDWLAGLGLRYSF